MSRPTLPHASITDARVAALAYALAAVGMTWPLAGDLGRNVPGDFGDPLLNVWIIGWNLRTLGLWVSGQVASAADWWNATIFHPEPLALAYSELLVAPSLLALPVHLLTGNLLLSYNLLFLASIVLSGLGMYLFAREQTRSAPAAFLAGAIYAFLPYRLEQVSHLHVLSSQWMPFVLFGLTRFASRGSLRALAGAAGALVLQNLSSGYYMVYFAGFVPAWACFELWRFGRLGDRRAWAWLVGAGVLALACTAPFMTPYFLLHDATSAERPIAEVQLYSANLLAWVTAPASSWAWGDVLRVWRQPEGQLFPGSMAVVLSLAAACWLFRPEARGDQRPPTRARALVLCLAGFAAAAVLLSLGPTPAIGAHHVPALGGPFRAMYGLVPGFDGLRVAARFGMIAGLFVAALAGLGWARLPAAVSQRTWPSLVAAAVVALEGLALPFPVNVPLESQPPLLTPAHSVFRPSAPPAAYRQLAALCPAVVVAELPLGDAAWDLRAVYGSTVHWRRLVNGFSGYQSRDYRARAQRLRRPTDDPEAAWAALVSSGATHVLLNKRAYPAEDIGGLLPWLSSRGAQAVGEFGHTTLFEMPNSQPVCP